MKHLDKDEYFDKVYGGWLGKCLGGAAGAPVEGIKKLIEGSFWENMQPDLPNDDLDLQLLWLETVREKGLGVTAKDLADAWNEKCWYPFNEYGIFLKNYDRGIWPPTSGDFNNPLFCEGEGAPIRSEIWSMLFPGNPEEAAKFAKLDASLDHSGEAVWIEQFYAAMGSEAFFCQDVHFVIEKCLHYLPERSKARSCADLVLRQATKDWKVTRASVLRYFGHNDFTNAVTNLGLVLVALIYGENSMANTIDIAYRCGFDTDCTCATAAAFLGILFGAKAIDPTLKAMVQDTFVSGIDLEDENRSIRVLAEKTCKLGETLRKNPPSPLLLSVRYDTMPSLGINDICSFSIMIENNSEIAVKGTVHLDNLPEFWHADWIAKEVTVNAHSKLWISNTIDTYNTAIVCLKARNILKLSFKEQEYLFGIAGASIWSVFGPFFEALVKEDPRDLPKPHPEGCILPNLECMVNNAAYLGNDYPVSVESLVEMNAKEDILPFDELFPFFTGQGCLYAKQEFLSPDDRDVWLVVGNNDGCKVWVNDVLVLEKDEIRLWTPYNNSNLVHLQQGKNTIWVKLLKRTENLKFSIAFRLYEGVHFHRKRWIVDMDSLVP